MTTVSAETSRIELVRNLALTAVGGWLEANAGESRPLSPVELRACAKPVGWRNCLVAGWRIHIEIDGDRYPLNLLVDEGFPWKPAHIATVDSGAYLTIPHIESDGTMCLLPGQAEVDADNPVGGVKLLLAEASALLLENRKAIQSDDFRNEFRSYWLVDERATEFRSLLSIQGPSRYVKVWRGKYFHLFAESAEHINSWLDHIGSGPSERRTISTAVFLWLDQALLPEQYPNTAADVLGIASGLSDEAVTLLRGGVASGQEELQVVFGAQTDNGPALAGVTIQKPLPQVAGRNVKIDTISKGFRGNHVPPMHVQSLMLGGRSVLKSDVERVDVEWVHGRGKDPHQSVLFNKSAVLIGCGSLGSAVAEKLAAAGVGQLSLIDPEILVWANIGRHQLGAQSIGHFKANELRRVLLNRFPHMREINAFPQTWQRALQSCPMIFDEADIVVSTVGSWGDEGMLNDWLLALERPVPALYGWTEPHACAGQAVLILKEGCFACGLDKFGVPHLRVTDWPKGSLAQEPACGAVFQPYGPAELSFIVGMIANLALGALLGKAQSSTQRIWCGSKDLLLEAGGTLTAEWNQIAQGREEYFQVSRPWLRNPECPLCSR